ncbi:MAG TPA: hypothetical protein VIG24_16900 [Acidimicrobiia bacterium]
MAQNTTIACPAGVWTLLTNSDVTALRAVNLGTEGIFLQGTVGTVAPSTTAGALPLLPNQIIAADLELTKVFPGVVGANRVYAYAASASSVSVSHA